jgi:hypothetical protein
LDSLKCQTLLMKRKKQKDKQQYIKHHKWLNFTTTD